jgi:hypothetical protein
MLPGLEHGLFIRFKMWCCRASFVSWECRVGRQVCGCRVAPALWAGDYEPVVYNSALTDMKSDRCWKHVYILVFLSEVQAVRRLCVNTSGSYSWGHSQTEMSHEHGSDSQRLRSYGYLKFKMIWTLQNIRVIHASWTTQNTITDVLPAWRGTPTFQSTRDGVPERAGSWPMD